MQALTIKAVTLESAQGFLSGLDGFQAELLEAEDGSYLFRGLPAGPYRVTITQADLPQGVRATADPDGGADSTSALTLAESGSADAMSVSALSRNSSRMSRSGLTGAGSARKEAGPASNGDRRRVIAASLSSGTVWGTPGVSASGADRKRSPYGPGASRT